MTILPSSLRIIGILICVMLLDACAVGNVNKHHSALQNITPETPVANVYLLRPRMLKLKGASRGVLKVSFNGEVIADLGAGEYTLVKIHPGQSRVATHSLSKFTNQARPIQVSRFRDYNFIENMTYFIHISRVDEEFRGVFFDPKSVSLDTAKNLLYTLSAFGAAKDSPLESLDHVDLPAAPSELPIVTPENLYPDEKYLLTPKPFK